MPIVLSSPWMAAFVALAGIPVLVHLFARRKPRRVPVSSLNHIDPVVRQTRRMRRPRQLVLLALRCLLVLLLALLFARPVYFPRRTGLATGRISRAVIVIDRSMSMQCNEGGLTRFGSAQVAAEQVLDVLPTGARANLVWLDDTCTTTVDGLTDNLAALRQDLKSRRVGCGQAAAGQALDAAVSLLGAEGGQVYLVSDFQATNWQQVDPATLPDNVHVVNIVVGNPALANLGVVDLRLAPSAPAVNEPFRVSARVGNYGPEAVSTEVTLEAAAAVQQRQVLLEPYSETTVVFDVRRDRRGPCPIRVSVPEDALSADNTRYAEVDVAASLSVVLVEMVDDRGYDCLAAACRADGAGETIRVTELPEAALAQLGRTDADVVMLYGWDGTGDRRMHEWMSRSGAAVVWLLPGREPVDVSGGLWSRLGKEVTVGPWVEPDKPVSLSVADGRHPLMDVFDRGRSGDVARATFAGYRRLACTGGQAVLAWPDGSAALLEVNHADGRLLVWNMPIDPDVSTFAGGNVFLPLVREVVRRNRRRRLLPRGRTGVPLALALPVDADPGSLVLEVSTAAGTERQPRSAFAVMPEQDRLKVVVSTLEQPGHYRFVDRGGPVQSASVNAPAVESDLRSLPPEQPGGGAAATATVTLGETSIHDLHRGVPLWPALAVAVVFLFFAEMLVLALWRIRT